jgi:hypothetical protein
MFWNEILYSLLISGRVLRHQSSCQNYFNIIFKFCGRKDFVSVLETDNATAKNSPVVVTISVCSFVRKL